MTEVAWVGLGAVVAYGGLLIYVTGLAWRARRTRRALRQLREPRP